MKNLFSINPANQVVQYDAPIRDGAEVVQRLRVKAERDVVEACDTFNLLTTATSRNIERMTLSHTKRATQMVEQYHDIIQKIGQSQAEGLLFKQYQDYLKDAAERMLLTTDTLRKRGNIFVDHETQGCPPVLVYDYDIVMDGKDMQFPCNYMLLKIKPPKGIKIDDDLRPYIVIDPRAGHGPGIGGFKSDSQVGVALRAGHPVYFVAFRREPEPNQYISFVTRAEAEFVREVTRRHINAKKPVVIGNCQGGWATLLLAATNQDLTGPIVINGAPVAPWAGKIGENPMRYNAGVTGGTWIPMFLSDIGGGIFDGAHLVQNFELLNPGRTLFRKYADLFRHIDHGDEAFLEFEKWWGGFFLLNEAEIKWIVEQLFVGNRLTKNEARLEPGRPVDLKLIKAPIIVFASHGDNITPPQQALNWIADTYADVSEIRIRGQRIIYMVHEQVGHLGIFVSSQIANKEHSQVASTLETIEAMAPGLYEMKIDNIDEKDGSKHFTVSFIERSLNDIRSLDDGHHDERPFAAVARYSEVQAQMYDALIRPVVQSVITPSIAQASRTFHPQRLSRQMMSSDNPFMKWVETAAQELKAARTPLEEGNPLLALEDYWVSMTEQWIDLCKDTRDMNYELYFHTVWGTPWARTFGKTHEARRTLKDLKELRGLPEVTMALSSISEGGFVEAVIRMLILLAENKGQVRRDRLERSSMVLTQDEPFKSLGPDRRKTVIHQQTLIVTYEPELALSTLPYLLPDRQQRDLALRVVRYIPGSIHDMSAETLALLQKMAKVLGLDAIVDDVVEDPLCA